MWFVPSFQREHEHLLRPNLGHPHQKDKLAALYDQETQRHKEYLDAVDMRTSTLQVIGLQMRVSDISTNFHNNIVLRGQRKCFKWFMTYKQIKHSLLDIHKIKAVINAQQRSPLTTKCSIMTTFFQINQSTAGSFWLKWLLT